MHPDLATIVRYRHAVETAIRLAALVCAVATFWDLIALVIMPLWQSGAIRYVRTQITTNVFGHINLMPAILGVGLYLLARPIARWAVPPQRPGCVHCGYGLAGVKTEPGRPARCPECGTDQPPAPR